MGMIALLLLGIVLYLQSRSAHLPKVEGVPGQAPAIEEFVKSCVNKVGEEGVYVVANHGGYITPRGAPKYGEFGDGLAEAFWLEQGAAPYVVDGKVVSLRSLDDMMGALQRYIAVELDSCLDFGAFEYGGVRVQKPVIDWQDIDFDVRKAVVNYSSARVDVQVIARPDANDLVLQVKYPLLLTSPKGSFPLEDFTVVLPYRLSFLYKVVRALAFNIADAQARNQVYVLSDHCGDYRSLDGMVNIYAQKDGVSRSVALSVVDAHALDAGTVPLRFQFAAHDVSVNGECVG